MANIAQMVNVLQAVILTEGEKMIKTPTYHVFDLYRVHFDTRLLHTNAQIKNYEYNNEMIPALSYTASKSENGRINITITNTDAVNSQEIDIDIRGQNADRVSSGKILTANEVSTTNTFQHPNRVSLEDFEGYELSDNTLSLTLSSKSVVMITIN